MGLSRRFHNVILKNRLGGAKSLCSVDLTRQLFDNTVRPASTIGDGSESIGVQCCTPQILAAEVGNQKNELRGSGLKDEEDSTSQPNIHLTSCSESAM